MIYGIPIYTALFGPQVAIYPIFASISSFFFQLPIQLVLFEIDERRRTRENLRENIEHDAEKGLEEDWMTSALVLNEPLWKAFLKILLKLVINPVLAAIVGGILFSLTEWDLPMYLDQLCVFAGTAVTPLASFSIGIFMYRKLPKGWGIWIFVTIELIVKFFIMPLLVMPFLIAFDINGTPRRIGVLMSALPVALSCYVLSVRYKCGEELATVMVVFSSILMLPTQLMWLSITESMGWL